MVPVEVGGEGKGGLEGGLGGGFPPKGGQEGMGGWNPPLGGPGPDPPRTGGSGGSPPRASNENTFTFTDEMIASMLADPFPAQRRPRLKLGPLIPVVHGLGALTTFMLAVLAAISTRLGPF